MANMVNLSKSVSVTDLPAMIARLLALLYKPMWVDNTTSTVKVGATSGTIASGAIASGALASGSVAAGAVATGAVVDYNFYTYPITRDLNGASWGANVGRLIN